MSKVLFNLSRIIAVLVTAIYSIGFLIEGNISRVLLMFVATFLFVFTLIKYEKKFEVYSMSMFFYVIVCYFSFTFAPFIWDSKKLLELANSRPAGSVTPGDHFVLYGVVAILVSAIFLCYIYQSRYQKQNTDKISKIQSNQLNSNEVITSRRQDFMVLVALVCIIIPLFYLIDGESKAAIGVCAFTYFALRLVYGRKSINIYVILGLILSCVFIVSKLLGARFMLVKFVVPVGIGFVTYYCLHPEAMKKKTAYLLILFATIGILLYGVVSEIIKLNAMGSGYNITDVLLDYKSNLKFIHNQIYRVFEIWTPLGGNIIELVQREGYFYGITYIKFLAPYLGFPYISLPKINAQYIFANYAQPGLLAEGYANFGVIGAVLNLVIVLALAEFLFRRFMKNKNMLNLCLMLAPFTAILIDGGTLNDAIINIVLIFLTFSISFVTGANPNKALYNVTEKRKTNKAISLNTQLSENVNNVIEHGGKQ